MLDYKRRK